MKMIPPVDSAPPARPAYAATCRRYLFDRSWCEEQPAPLGEAPPPVQSAPTPQWRAGSERRR